MRNLLVLTAALGLAGVANAQNSATVNQTGTTNDADVTQALGATINVTQGLDANKLTATQSGNSDATIVQSSLATPATGGHIATITQIGGDGNFIDLRQSWDGTLGSTQTGKSPDGNHTATLTQNGSDNRISGAANDDAIDGFDPASQQSRSNRVATVNQQGNDNVVEFSNGNPLDIFQDGDRNFAQSSGGATVNIDQIGDDNSAISVGNRNTTIYQFGDNNEAEARGYLGNANIDINQAGSFNVATGIQMRSGTMDVDQDGDYNSSVIDFGDGSRTPNTGGASFDVTQDAGTFGAAGASNVFDATVRFNDNSATVTQTLTGAGMNRIDLDQLTAGNTATLTQSGVGNTQTVVQQ